MGNHRKRNSGKFKILVAFGDISGFSYFWDSVTDEQKELLPFLRAYDKIIERAERETGWDFVDLGDGFMVTVDLSQNGHSCRQCLAVLLRLHKLIKEINSLFQKTDALRPTGYRITGAVGYVIRRVNWKGKIFDRGRPMNLASHMQRLTSDGILIHRSWKDTIGDRLIKKHGLILRPFLVPATLPKGVNSRDAERIWVFEGIKKPFEK